MKNKKWKRKAKRIIGECFKHGCSNCKYLSCYGDETSIINECYLDVPPSYGIRNLEIIIKNDNMGRYDFSNESLF